MWAKFDNEGVDPWYTVACHILPKTVCMYIAAHSGQSWGSCTHPLHDQARFDMKE